MCDFQDIRFPDDLLHALDAVCIHNRAVNLEGAVNACHQINRIILHKAQERNIRIDLIQLREFNFKGIVCIIFIFDFDDRTQSERIPVPIHYHTPEFNIVTGIKLEIMRRTENEFCALCVDHNIVQPVQVDVFFGAEMIDARFDHELCVGVIPAVVKGIPHRLCIICGIRR